MTTVPVLFGYVRLREPDSANQLPVLKRRIRRFASHEGFALAEILLELERGGTAAFNRLLELMALHPGSRAIVPTLEHLAELAQLQRALSQLIERETGNTILVLPPSRSTAERHSQQTAESGPASNACINLIDEAPDTGTERRPQSDVYPPLSDRPGAGHSPRRLHLHPTASFPPNCGVVSP